MKNKNEKAESNLKNIFAAAKAENSESLNLEIVKSSNLENETLVNLGVKIPASHRNFWNSKAALQGLSMKSIIVSALIEKLGKPE
jgi:hypothetical protein